MSWLKRAIALFTIAAGGCVDADKASDTGSDVFADTALDSDTAPDCTPLIYHPDVDGDGSGDRDVSTEACEGEQPDGWVLTAADCNDRDPTIHPGAAEICDGKDNDCDGTADEDVSTTYWRDADGDGYGDPEVSLDACDEAPEGYVDNRQDCNDEEPAAYTRAADICDGIDNDCDGTVDEDEAERWYPDADGDTFGIDEGRLVTCDPPSGYAEESGDCDDGDPAINPDAAEVCDGIDNDCDGDADPWGGCDIPPGCTYEPYVRSGFWFCESDTRITAPDAFAVCYGSEELHVSLAFFEDTDESDFVLSHAREYFGDDVDFWIGLYRASEASPWAWYYAGVGLSFEAWGDGEPSPEDRRVSMSTNDGFWKGQTVDDTLSYFVCKADPRAT